MHRGRRCLCCWPTMRYEVEVEVEAAAAAQRLAAVRLGATTHSWCRTTTWSTPAAAGWSWTPRSSLMHMRMHTRTRMQICSSRCADRPAAAVYGHVCRRHSHTYMHPASFLSPFLLHATPAAHLRGGAYMHACTHASAHRCAHRHALVNATAHRRGAARQLLHSTLWLCSRGISSHH